MESKYSMKPQSVHLDKCEIEKVKRSFPNILSNLEKKGKADTNILLIIYFNMIKCRKKKHGKYLEEWSRYAKLC